MLKELIRVVKEKDPAIKGNSEVLLYPSFWATISHRIAHHFYKKKHYFIARLISQISILAQRLERDFLLTMVWV